MHNHPTLTAAAAAALLLTFAAGPVHATSILPPTPMETAWRQADAVVVGWFTGRETVELRQALTLDENGRHVELVYVVTFRQFEVTDVLDGRLDSRTVEVVLMGGELDGIVTEFAVDLPENGELVLLSVSETRPGVVSHHRQTIESVDPGDLTTLTRLVPLVRAPGPVDPDELHDLLESLRLRIEGEAGIAPARGR
jgi:hypothetical protein